MNEYLLIDAENGGEHDRYEELRPAMADAAVRAYGFAATPAHEILLDEHVDEILAEWRGRARFSGPFGTWIVEAVSV